MHAIEKILAAHSGRSSVCAGDVIVADIDFCGINDLYPQTMYSFAEIGGEKVWDKDKAACIFDHYAPCPSAKTAATHREFRTFRDKNQLTYHFDINKGVCHQVIAEAGLVGPGDIIVITDSHTTTHGAFGAFGTGVGATDMACILKTGKLWMKVPEVIEVRVEGTPKKGVYAKDVILKILGTLKADGAVYKCVEFTGSYIESLHIPERMTICNMALETGVKSAYIQPNEEVLQYAESHCVRPYTVQTTDKDYVYAESYVFDISDLKPQTACPAGVDNVFDVKEIEEKRIRLDQGYLGSCTNGRFEDIEIAAKILKGKHIADNVRFVVVPASDKVMRRCIDAGYIQDLLDAGATITAPGCAACLGVHQGLIAEGEVCISSTNRNFPGRMGSKNSSLYLASPAAVAASMLTGYITDPTDYDSVKSL